MIFFFKVSNQTFPKEQEIFVSRENFQFGDAHEQWIRHAISVLPVQQVCGVRSSAYVITKL